MLNVSGLCSGYGNVQIIWDASFSVNDGEVVAILGSNGAGKTTLVRTITGMIRPWKGSVLFDGEELAGKSSRAILDHGIVQVPEGRQLFTEMSVYENLEMGAYSKETKAKLGESLEFVYKWFPKLKERRNQAAGTLSGGEQQMLAMGRALMSKPTLLLLDEPSMGLSPILVNEIFDIIKSINKDGVTVLLVEQNANKELSIADRAYVLETGNVIVSGKANEVANNPKVREAYLG